MGRDVRHPHAGAGPARSHLVAARRPLPGARGHRPAPGPPLRHLRRGDPQPRSGALRDRRRPPRLAEADRYPRLLRPGTAAGAGRARCHEESRAAGREDPGRRRGRARLGEPGWSLHERTTVRPSLAVTGITGGYQGEGSKAVIPSRATAKLNFRLVPDQDPREIDLLVRRHLARVTPPTVRSRVTAQARARPAVLDRRHPVMRAAAHAYERGFGAAPVFLRSGGSIPIVNVFQEVLGLQTALMGFALPDSRIHAPDERFHLPTFERGIATCRAFLEAAAAMPVGRRARAAAVPA